MNDPKPTTHVDLSNVLAQVKLFPHVPNEIKRQYKAGTLSEDDFDVFTEAHVEPHRDVRKLNDQIIWKLRRTCRAEENYTPAKMDEPRSTREKIIDTLAMDFAKLCGLDDDPLGISATGTDNDKKNEPLLPDAVIRHNSLSDRTDELVIWLVDELVDVIWLVDELVSL